MTPQGGAGGGQLASMVQGLAGHTEAWAAASRKGENRLTRLINAKMELLYVDAPAHWGCLRHNTEVIGRVEGKLHEHCRHYTKLLRETCQELAQTHGKMEQALLPLRTTMRLALAKGDDATARSPVSSTLALDQAVGLAEELVSMYARDLHLKRLIVNDVASQSNRDVLIVYLTSWEMMPYVDRKRQDELFELLTPPPPLFHPSSSPTKTPPRASSSSYYEDDDPYA